MRARVRDGVVWVQGDREVGVHEEERVAVSPPMAIPYAEEEDGRKAANDDGTADCAANDRADGDMGAVIAWHALRRGRLARRAARR